jgi:hypothetical protein
MGVRFTLATGVVVSGCGEGAIGGIPAGATVIDAAVGALVGHGEMAVTVPPPGRGVWLEIVRASGAARTLHVETRPDHVVLMFHDVAGQAAGENGAKDAPDPCKDAAYQLLPWRWKTSFHWSFQVATTPPGLDPNDVATRLKRAARNITMARNSCGLPDQVGARQYYDGTTTQGVQVGPDGSCAQSGDGKNTVAFGELPSGVLGVACTWYKNGNEASEADIRLNSKVYHWVGSVPAGCVNRMSITAVATHEMGHVFGLGHVDEKQHGNLTMSPQLNGPCQTSEATLGLGDVKGLEEKY